MKYVFGTIWGIFHIVFFFLYPPFLGVSNVFDPHPCEKSIKIALMVWFQWCEKSIKKTHVKNPQCLWFQWFVLHAKPPTFCQRPPKTSHGRKIHQQKHRDDGFWRILQRLVGHFILYSFKLSKRIKYSLAAWQDYFQITWLTWEFVQGVHTDK